MKHSLDDVLWDDIALGMMHWPATGATGIVRPMKDGQFAVIELYHGERRIVKVLPTEQRARAYNIAIAEG